MRKLQAFTFTILMIVASGCDTALEDARNNISGTWRIESVTRNGNDDTPAYTQNREDYTIRFTQEGSFLEEYFFFGASTSTMVNGTYVINSSITQLNMDDANRSRIFQIDALEENVLTLTDLGSSDELQIKYAPQ